MTFVVAFDTSTEELAIGAGRLDEDSVEIAGEVNLDVPRATLTHLVPEVSRLLAGIGREMRDVEAIIVGRGPGSFTGVRIGVAAAKGMAQGLGVPLFAVGTLDVIAERFAEHDGLLGVVGDAMRREVYPALFRCRDGSVERLAPDTVTSPQAAATAWSRTGEKVMLAGNGLRKYADVFTSTMESRASIAPEPMWTPTGQALLRAAGRAMASGRLGDGDVGSVLPVYTRLSDAEENERALLGTSGGPPRNGVAGPDGTCS